MTRQRRGWGWPNRARKSHYIVDGESLCKSWRLDPKTPLVRYQEYDWREDDCADCRRKLHQKRYAR